MEEAQERSLHDATSFTHVRSCLFSGALRAQRAPFLLKLKPILQFFQQLIDLLRRFLRRSFLAITQFNLDLERQRYSELRLQLKEVWDDLCEILDLRWFKLGVGHEARGWCCGPETAHARAAGRPRSDS